MKVTILFVGLLAFLFTFSTQTFAATFVVDNNGDTNDVNTADNLCADSSNNCTLRAAIEQANASAGDDSITFSLAAASPIELTIGELPINTNIIIVGTGENQLTVQRSTTSATNFRIFNITGGVNVTISDLTISGGRLMPASFNLGVGGGIYNEGILNLINITVKNNNVGIPFNQLTSQTRALGGGIYNTGTLYLMNSTVSNNTSAGSITAEGGGIYSTGGLSLTNTIITGDKNMAKICFEPKEFRQNTLALIDKCNVILERYDAAGFDMTVRQVYYQLVAADEIENSEKSYNKIQGLLNDARLAGLVDWDFIVDRTRQLRKL